MLYERENPHGGDIYRQPVRLDFSVNTNPLGPPPGVIRAVESSAQLLDRYPDPCCRELVGALAAYEGVPERFILCGCGAAELIFSYCGALRPGKALELAPTFSEYAAALEAFGCQVERYALEEENGFALTEKFLDALEQTDCEVVFLCSPNNPTGRLTDPGLLAEACEICLRRGLRLFVDECFLELSDGGRSASLADQLERFPGLFLLKAFTKSYAMAGLRLGWIAGPRELTERLERQRDYHIISVGRLDDLLASVALESREAISTRNLAICREGGRLLAEFVAGEPHISYVKPKGGTTAFLRYDLPMESAELCRRLQEETGVMLLPGSALDMEGYLRIGYCNDPGITEAGLARFGEWLRQF